MPFHQESKPKLRTLVEVASDVFRVTADNPSLMTYHGTNTYLIEASDGTYVLDPGPASDQLHYRWLVEHLDGRCAGIILTHHHSDHFGLEPQMRAELDVPVYAYEIFADDTFKPDVGMKDGDKVAGLEALHTPGHASDHLCFAREDGILFSGDHVMAWNSSIVALPDGDMADYFEQLQRLVDRNDTRYLPGHGPSLEEPQPYTGQLLAHRERREAAIIKALEAGPTEAEALAKRLYNKTDPWLAMAAQRNVEAHLAKLQREAVVIQNAANEWVLITH